MLERNVAVGGAIVIPSVCLSVHLSVRLSVRLYVRPSDHCRVAQGLQFTSR